eukprot:TRINITY_DN869_c0_g1_i1.p1 TRINITY_DN869_c0_g1~~TRINITY_DN869_c0_g1_i1.p1  ORF type:complete len:200 (+),score=34.53 TRINITY_DN869_c0_g1_i1:22-600(+)
MNRRPNNGRGRQGNHHHHHHTQHQHQHLQHVHQQQFYPAVNDPAIFTYGQPTWDQNQYMAYYYPGAVDYSAYYYSQPPTAQTQAPVQQASDLIMEADFLRAMVEHAISAADATDMPFSQTDPTLYFFSVHSLNDGEQRYYDGTLYEIWPAFYRDVKATHAEAGLAEDCYALVFGEDHSFDVLLTEVGAEYAV